MRQCLVLLALALAACQDSPPPRTVFEPLRYDYLTPLHLNVSRVEIGEPPPPGPLDAQSPAPPGPALKQMAQDRLTSGGSAGQAVFTIDQAQIIRTGTTLDGVMAVHLEVAGPPGSGRAEAQVTRQLTNIDRDALRGALYDLTKQMLADMNVELEFQIRRTLKDWLQDTTTAPLPPPVQTQDLPAL